MRMPSGATEAAACLAGVLAGEVIAWLARWILGL